MTLKIYLVRHGQTEANARRIFQGWLDLPLTENGRTQAHWVGDRLAQVELDRIYTSPLKRALETAQIIGQVLEASKRPEIILEAALKEMNFGRFDGLSSAELEARYPREYRRWQEDWVDSAPPGGERARDMFQRVCTWFDDLTQEGGDPNNPYRPANVIASSQNILIVTHEGVILQILAHILGLDLAHCWRLRVEPGSLTEVQINHGYAVLTRLNHTAEYLQAHR